jgi:general secretion pathway protein A
MYKKLYGLSRNPFEIAPDPYFLFPTERYNEALAAIFYGIRRRKGFVVITGEVGTGKTLLVRCLLEMLTLRQVSFANVFNPLLSGADFLRYITGDLGLKPADHSKSSLLLALNEFLIARYRRGLTTVLVVDEAHQLSLDLLEEIRLLTNLETSHEKLLQILLVGQPELEQRLDYTDLRQLKQRIALRCRLEPLAENETRDYIIKRLQRAGMTEGAESVFPPETTSEIYHHSHGIPRLINTLCENSIITAFARQIFSVTPAIVREISTEFRLGREMAKASSETDGQDSETGKTLLLLLEQLQRYRFNSASKPVAFP